MIRRSCALVGPQEEVPSPAALRISPDGGKLVIPPGTYRIHSVLTDYIAAKDGMKYLHSVQTRHGPGQRLQTRVARLGWGAEAAANTGVDGTFYTDEEARPYEHSHTYGGHPINGGGPIASQVRAHGLETVPTLIAKATPVAVQPEDKSVQ